MFKNLLNNLMKKSPKERFLLVIGMLLFSLYLFMGLAVIFWEVIFSNRFPLQMASNYRWAFGIILIVYSFLRFLRFFNSNRE
jgi:hypothetical protein